MSLSRSFLYALATTAAAGMFAACSTNGIDSGAHPISALQITPATSSTALLYVSDLDKRVSFYAYPSLTYAGELSGLKYPTGLCTDPRTQDVWVAWDFNKVSEFAHGATKPIRTLEVVADIINSCAVNPTNGDLALTEPYDYDDAGALLVLKNASGQPTIYQGKNMFYYDFVGYDAEGDAFVDGGGGPGFQLDELSSGGTKLVNATPHRLSPKRSPGGVQYDGTDIAVGYEKLDRVYRISDRTVVGATRLSGACRVQQFAIAGNTLIAPNSCHSHGDVLIYDYPSGGVPSGKITGFKNPFAVTISE